jgi:hypothetical protein
MMFVLTSLITWLSMVWRKAVIIMIATGRLRRRGWNGFV